VGIASDRSGDPVRSAGSASSRYRFRNEFPAPPIRGMRREADRRNHLDKEVLPWRRASPFSLCAVCVVCPTSFARQPEGLAGTLIANGIGLDALSSPAPAPAMTAVYGPGIPLGPDDTLTLDMAIVPFLSGATVLALDGGDDSLTFVDIEFRDGMVEGL